MMRSTPLRSYARLLDEHRFPFSEMSDDELGAWKAEEIHRAQEFVAGRQMVAA